MGLDEKWAQAWLGGGFFGVQAGGFFDHPGAGAVFGIALGMWAYLEAKKRATRGH